MVLNSNYRDSWSAQSIMKWEERLLRGYHFVLSKVNSLFLGFCPTSKELVNTRLQQLADNMKVVHENGKIRDKETLTNLLSWEHRNLIFWSERFKPVTFFYIISASSVTFLTFLSLFFYYSCWQYAH
jgi:hypothetical protein